MEGRLRREELEVDDLTALRRRSFGERGCLRVGCRRLVEVDVVDKGRCWGRLNGRNEEHTKGVSVGEHFNRPPSTAVLIGAFMMWSCIVGEVFESDAQI